MESSAEQVKPLRGVTYEHEFDSDAKLVSSDFFRMDAFLQGVEWVLARDPTAGTQITENVWCISVAPVDGLPRAMVYYTFNRNNIWFLRLRVVSEE